MGRSDRSPCEPLLSISMALGMAPLNSELKSDKSAMLKFCVFSALFFLKCANEIWNLYSVFYVNSALAVVIPVAYSCEIGVALAHIISIGFFAKKYEKLAKIIRSLDSMGVRHFRITSYDTCLGLLYISGDVILGILMDTTQQGFKFFLFGKISEAVTFIVVMQFCAILEVLRYHFELSVIQLTLENSLFHSSRLEMRTTKQLDLIKAVDKTNYLYSMQILVVFIKITFNIVFHGSTLPQFIYLLDGPYPPDEVLSKLFTLTCYLFYNLYIMLLISGSCVRVKSEVDRFNEQLFKVLTEKKSLWSNRNLRLYAQMKPTVNFTACGFFSIGYPLVTSVIAASTTYLVIIMQFRNGK